MNKVTATDVDPTAFGFSAADLASSLGAYLRGLLGSKSAFERVQDIVDPKALQYNHYRAAQRVLSAWTANSTYAGLVRVNQPLKAGFINFFILEHNYLDRKARNLSCGCNYVPGSWSIVCDGLFLSSAQRLLEEKGKEAKRPTVPESKKPEDGDDTTPKFTDDDADQLIHPIFRQFLFEWIIAHEVGHLVNNHTEKDLARSWTYDNGVAVGLAAEKEADEFYISKLQHEHQRQFGAWLGLSNVITSLNTNTILTQHAGEVQAEIDKHGGFFPFRTELGIQLHYVPDKHPPMLLRALNLADLVIERYPQMFDTTGYFSRVRNRIKLEIGKEPDSPQLCRKDLETDEDTSEEQVLARQVSLLLAQSAPRNWTQAAIDKLRQFPSKQSDPHWRTVSSLATDLFEALAQPDSQATSAGIERVDAARRVLPEPQNGAISLLVRVARARAGLLPDTKSVKDALDRAQDQVNEMARKGAIDLKAPAQRADALFQLLHIALSHTRERDAGVEATINAIVHSLLEISDLNYMDQELLLLLLQSDYAWTSAGSPSKDRAKRMADAAMRVAELAQQQYWPVIKTRYLALGLALEERLEPKPLTELMIGYRILGRELTVHGMKEAPSIVQRGIDSADALLKLPDTTPAEKSQISELRLQFLNNLGWTHLALREFSEALAPLKEAREGRVAQRASRVECQKENHEDTEFATVNQNLADVSLAVGSYSDALEYARQARQCRTQLEIKLKILESTKTEGYARIYSGDESAGKALVQEYSDSIRQLLDDDRLPSGDPFISGAIVNGEFIPLERYAHGPEDRSRPRQLRPSELLNLPAPEESVDKK